MPGTDIAIYYGCQLIVAYSSLPHRVGESPRQAINPG